MGGELQDVVESVRHPRLHALIQLLVHCKSRRVRAAVNDVEAARCLAVVF